MGEKERKNKSGSTFGQRLVMLTCTALVGLVILAGIVYGLWRLLAGLDHGTLAALALGAILAVPAVGLGGWKLGHMEARGVLAGLGLGVGTVMGAATDVADVRVNTIRTVREVQTPAPTQVVLPRLIDVTPRYQDDEILV